MLYLNLIWHMHQPCYLEPESRKVFFPWVWVHTIHDYYSMANILKSYPSVKVTFNLVPSLIEQIGHYVDGSAEDFFWDFCHRYPDINEEEKKLFLRLCFSIDEERMIKPYSRFDAIKQRFYREESISDEDIVDAAAWFVLSWLSTDIRRSNPEVEDLIGKRRNFTKEDLFYLEDIVKKIASDTIELYRELHDNGQIEVSTTPFYHPILPLIIDTNIMSVCMPDAPVPSPEFSFREDAISQVRMAVNFYESIFGKKPAGMWPAEGAVSEDAIKIMEGEGVRWIATDEAILAKSFAIDGKNFIRNDIYSPYRFGNVFIFFRDRELSDLIGFTYSGWESSADAAKDFINRLEEIADKTGNIKNPVVTVALDGENPWEYYPNGGYDFLKFFYEGLSSSKKVKTVLPSEYLDKEGCRNVISSLYPGSWINADFSTWIGETEKNRAWNLLRTTREFMMITGKKVPQEAWKYIYRAEGSDWFWWFGETHFTRWHEEFDALFRSNLIAVYRLIGNEPPSELLLPVKLKKSELMKRPISFIYPEINGRVDGYMEWLGSGEFDVRREVSSIAFGYKYVVSINIGFSKDRLFILLKGEKPYNQLDTDVSIKLCFIAGKEQYLSSFPIKNGRFDPTLYRCDSSCDCRVGEMEVVVDKVAEAAVDWRYLNASPGSSLEVFVVVVDQLNRTLERIPHSGLIEIEVPSEDFEERNWFV